MHLIYKKCLSKRKADLKVEENIDELLVQPNSETLNLLNCIVENLRKIL